MAKNTHTQTNTGGERQGRQETCASHKREKKKDREREKARERERERVCVRETEREK